MAKATLTDLRLLDRASFLREVAGADDDLSYLVLFETGGPDEAATRAALAAAGNAHPERIRVFRAPFAGFREEFAKMEAERKDIDSFNFRRAPVVGLYRQGRLVTTFNPRRIFYIPKQQAREVHDQLAIFLNKMVFFDPGKVREQVNLEVAKKTAEHQAKEAAKPAAAGAGAAPAGGAQTPAKAAGGGASPAKPAAAAGSRAAGAAAGRPTAAKPADAPASPAGTAGSPSAPPAAAAGTDVPVTPARAADAQATEAGDTGKPPADKADGAEAPAGGAAEADRNPGGQGSL